MDLSQDILDSRDLINYLEELEAELEEWVEDDGKDEEKYLYLSTEIEKMLEIIREGEQTVSDWKYGETLISEDYFTQYAEELADELGLIDSKAHWPTCYIDWEAAAESLKMDYTSIDIEGRTYYARS